MVVLGRGKHGVLRVFRGLLAFPQSYGVVLCIRDLTGSSCSAVAAMEILLQLTFGYLDHWYRSKETSTNTESHENYVPVDLYYSVFR